MKAEGTLRYDYEDGYCGELIAANGVTVCTFVDEPSAEDARRLVACWNACVGLTIEQVEALGTGGVELKKAAVRDVIPRTIGVLREWAPMKDGALVPEAERLIADLRSLGSTSSEVPVNRNFPSLFGSGLRDVCGSTARGVTVERWPSLDALRVEDPFTHGVPTGDVPSIPRAADCHAQCANEQVGRPRCTTECGMAKDQGLPLTVGARVRCDGCGEESPNCACTGDGVGMPREGRQE